MALKPLEYSWAHLQEKIAHSKPEALWKIFDISYEFAMSYEIEKSQLFDGVLFRGVHRARKIAEHLIDEEGQLNLKRLEEIEALLISTKPLPYPSGISDQIFWSQMGKAILALRKNKDLRDLLMKFRPPLCHHYAEKLILRSLLLEESTHLTDSLVRRAVLAAILSPLRQNVGSCFATAPAILIQTDQIHHLLEDLYALLSVGVLKRVIRGVEYSVPICPTLSSSALKKPFMPGVNPASCPIVKQLYIGYGFTGKLQGRTLEEVLKNSITKQLGISSKEFEMAQGNASKPEMAGVSQKAAGALQAYSQIEGRMQSYTEHPLLKAWEYTLASLSDYKIDFFKWNLGASLGFSHEDPGGLGELIYTTLHAQLEKSNREVEKNQQELEIAADQARTTETLLNSADSYDKARRLKAELIGHVHHMNTSHDMRDEAYANSEQYSQFFSFLLEIYQTKFKEYFQEIYDPSMHDLSQEIYDDSPAGFRLVYKHGRSDPSVWTLIYDEKQYIECLVTFFIQIEAEIIDATDWKRGKKEIPELTTAIVHHLRTDEFLHSAYVRMAKLHRVPIRLPIEDHSKLEKKPWSYTSGGSMNTLIQCYYGLEKDLTVEERWVENPVDLLTFYLETLKAIPYRLEESFVKDPTKSLLAYSPTHAFLLKPGLPFFYDGWRKNAFSYTWIRDEVIAPQRQFYNAISLDMPMQNYLAKAFFTAHPFFSPKTNFPSERGEISPSHFREKMKHHVKKMHPTIPTDFLTDHIDGFLKSALPCFPMESFFTKTQDLLPKLSGEYITYLEAVEVLRSADLDAVEILRNRDMAPPKSVIIADTNWMKRYFAFTFNPGSEEFELWRMDILGIEGMPMSIWKSHIYGESKKTWGVYIKPKEYSEARMAGKIPMGKKV